MQQVRASQSRVICEMLRFYCGPRGSGQAIAEKDDKLPYRSFRRMQGAAVQGMPSKAEFMTAESLPVPEAGQPHLGRRGPVAIGAAMIYAALAGVLLERITAVASDLQLWSDGSWFLVKVASSRTYYFWIGDWTKELFRSRLFTILVEQTPLVLATHLRIHSLHELSLIFGITLYSHALLSLYLCYRYAAKQWHMLFPLLSFFAGTMNVEAYLATDSHFVVSLYWPLLFILLFRVELSRATTILLVVLSIPTILSYESMIFFGLILAGVCMWRWKRNPTERPLMVGLATWYVAGAILAAAAVIWPFDATNREGFLRGLLYLLHSSHLAAQISLVVLLCCAGLLAVPSQLRWIQSMALSVGLAAVGYLFLEVFRGQDPTSLNVEVQARVLNVVLPLAATVLLFLVITGWSKPDSRAIGFAAILIGALGIGQVFWNLAAITRWQAMLATLRYELILHEGPLVYGDSVLSRQLGPLHLNELHAGWPLLPLSLYVQDRSEIRSLIVPAAGSYLPFDPFAPATFPDLSRYRIRYDGYRKFLAHQWQYRLGETLTFSRGGSAALFMRGNWQQPEDWATWGSGPDFGLELPMNMEDLPKTVLLSAMVSPNLSPTYPALAVQVLVNNVAVGTWSFQQSPDVFATRTVPIPRDVLTLANPVQIRFHVSGALHSPSEMGKGQDPRKLTLAFLKLTLQGVE